VTDGPLSTKPMEAQQGFWVVDVENEGRAVDIAAQISEASDAPFEVRECASARMRRRTAPRPRPADGDLPFERVQQLDIPGWVHPHSGADAQPVPVPPPDTLPTVPSTSSTPITRRTMPRVRRPPVVAARVIRIPTTTRAIAIARPIIRPKTMPAAVAASASSTVLITATYRARRAPDAARPSVVGHGPQGVRDSHVADRRALSRARLGVH